MIELDFVPNWYRSSQRRRSELTLRITVLCLLVAVMLIWSLRNLTNVRAAEADLAAVRSSYQLQSGALEQLDDLQAQLNQLDQRRQLVERVRGGLSSDQILAEITRRMPQAMLLTRVALIQDERIKLLYEDGQVYGQPEQAKGKLDLEGLASSHLDVGAFYTALDHSPCCQGVKVEYSKPSEVNGRKAQQFRISCQLPFFQ